MAGIGAAAYRAWDQQAIPTGLPCPQPDRGETGTILNDASRLDPTPVARHLTLSDAPDTKLLAALRTELTEACSAGLAFSASAARHFIYLSFAVR